MSRLVQNRFRNTWLYLKPSYSFSISSSFIKHLSTASSQLPEETLDESSSQSKEIWNVIVGKSGDRVSEDEVSLMALTTKPHHLQMSFLSPQPVSGQRYLESAPSCLRFRRSGVQCSVVAKECRVKGVKA